LDDRKGIWPVKTEWWDAGMVICLGRGAADATGTNYTVSQKKS